MFSVVPANKMLTRLSGEILGQGTCAAAPGYSFGGIFGWGKSITAKDCKVNLAVDCAGGNKEANIYQVFLLAALFEKRSCWILPYIKT